MKVETLIEKIKEKFEQFFKTNIIVELHKNDLHIKIYYKNFNDFESNIYKYKKIQDIYKEEFDKWVGRCDIVGSLGNRQYNMEFIAHAKRWIVVNDLMEPFLDEERFGL